MLFISPYTQYSNPFTLLTDIVAGVNKAKLDAEKKLKEVIMLIDGNSVIGIWISVLNLKCHASYMYMCFDRFFLMKFNAEI